MFKKKNQCFDNFTTWDVCVCLGRAHRWVHRVGEAVGSLPPRASPTSCWPPLSARQGELREAHAQLGGAVSTPAGGERDGAPGEQLSVTHVSHCCHCASLQRLATFPEWKKNKNKMPARRCYASSRFWSCVAGLRPGAFISDDTFVFV